MQTGCGARLRKTQRRETESGTETIQSLIGHGQVVMYTRSVPDLQELIIVANILYILFYKILTTHCKD